MKKMALFKFSIVNLAVVFQSDSFINLLKL